MNPVRGIAQSNIQLYGQLRDCGYSSADIGDVARGYRLAQPLFSARFRGSGRPFLCHLVGTASILARDAAPVHEVIAGLLHAVYSAGLFSFDMHRQLSRRKRVVVRNAVGTETEALIAAYNALTWDQAMLARLAEDMTPAQRPIVKLRLANELDDLADNGLDYSGKAKRSLMDSRESRNLLAQLASRVSMPALEAGMQAALADFAEQTDTLPAAPGTVDRDYSYTLLPPCAAERPTYRLAVLRRRVRRRFWPDGD